MSRELVRFQGTDLVKVITGVRMCGKSTLLDVMREHLRSQGVPDKRLLVFRMMPMSDSVGALSHGDDAELTEGLVPLSRMVLETSADIHWAQRSLWWTRPSGGLLRAMAILRASSAGSAVILGPIDQPTTILDHMSITTARYSHPCLAAT